MENEIKGKFKIYKNSYYLGFGKMLFRINVQIYIEDVIRIFMNYYFGWIFFQIFNIQYEFYLYFFAVIVYMVGCDGFWEVSFKSLLQLFNIFVVRLRDKSKFFIRIKEKVIGF